MIQLWRVELGSLNKLKALPDVAAAEGPYYDL